MQCPINYYTDNLIFHTDKSIWAAFKLCGVDYDFQNNENKIKYLIKTAKFLSGIISEMQILIVPVIQDNREHFDGIRMELSKRAKAGDTLSTAALNHLKQTETYLKESVLMRGNVNDYRTYIIAKLTSTDELELIKKAADAYQYFIKDPANAINVFMGADGKDILVSKIRATQKAAEEYLYKQNMKIRMSAVPEEEMQWLYRRMAYRGLATNVPLMRMDNLKREKWVPRAEAVTAGKEDMIRPLHRDILNLFTGTITTKQRVVKVDLDGEASYQTFMVVAQLPDVWEFPGNEWIYCLQREEALNAEICLHIKAVEHREALRKLDGKKREISSQIEHVASATNDLPEDLEVGKSFVNAMEAELKEDRYPMLQTSVSICVAAPDMDTLNNKVAAVKSIYEDKNIVIERPIADQIRLYMQFIPANRVVIRDYVLHLTPKTVASGVIGVGRELGDNKGFYIGTTGKEKKPVYLSMGEANLNNKSSAATFFGNLGVGKSFNANLLIVLNVLYGGYGLIFDPKGERSHWEKDFSLLHGYITTVTLSSDPSNKGKLDPYLMYSDDIDLANELAVNVLSELFKLAPSSDEYTALLDATSRVKTMTESGKRASMSDLITVLEEFSDDDDLKPVAKKLARRIALQRASGMAKLLIGDGTEEAISTKNRLNILQIQNLKLPSPETPKEDYSSEETLSTVIMMVLSHFAKKFALTKMPVFKTILFDESWALGKTVEGVKIFDFLSRMGRSLYTGCIFNGHSVLDIPTEGIKNTITYKFCFQTTNDSEASRMCNYMEMADTPYNREIFKSLRNRECMFMDADKHIGKLTWDAVFTDLINVFSTTPVTDEPVMEEAAMIEDSDIEAGDTINESKTTDTEVVAEPEETPMPEPIALIDEKPRAVEKEQEQPTQTIMVDIDFDDIDLYEKEEI